MARKKKTTVNHDTATSAAPQRTQPKPRMYDQDAPSSRMRNEPENTTRRRIYDQDAPEISDTRRQRSAVPTEEEVINRPSRTRDGMQTQSVEISIGNRNAVGSAHRQTVRNSAADAEQAGSAQKKRSRRKKNADSTRRKSVQEEPPVREPGDPALMRGQARKRRARHRRVLILFIMLVLAVGIYFSSMVLFKISEIAVTGTSIYDEDIIVETSGLVVGDNLFSFSPSQVETKLMQDLAYLGEVKVRRLLPGLVSIEVTSSQESYCFAYSDTPIADSAAAGEVSADSSPADAAAESAVESAAGDNSSADAEKINYAVTDANFKVLRVGISDTGLIHVLGVSIAEPIAGEKLVFNDETQQETLSQLLTALEASGLLAIDNIDISDAYNITMRCQNRFIIKLGTVSEIERKLRMVVEMVNNKLSDTDTGVIDVSSYASSNSAFFQAQSIN